MALIAVSILVSDASDVAAALARASEAARAGARMVEWRVDAIADDPAALKMITTLAKDSPAPCIVTCRLASEGGQYEGDEQTRVSLLEALAAGDHPPRYLDIEFAAYRSSANLRQKVQLAVDHPAQPRDLRTSLIVSAHDFNQRPPDLLQRIEAMAAEPACAVIKVAWTARSLRDNLEAFDLLDHRPKPMIALCMGQFGLMSRVLAGKFGGLLTFAGDRPATVTAPGQPTVDELMTLYRFDRIGSATKIYGVVGWPIEHSLSPAIHNAAFDAVGHDGVYLPLPIPPEWEHFKATVGAMIDHPRLDFRGASVTIPHKEHLLRFVHERGGRSDSMTDLIGAANTLVVGSAGGLACANTDCPAAVDALCAGMGVGREALPGQRVAVLGAGGVARAVAVGLAHAGAAVVVFNRTPGRARSMIDDLAARAAACGVAPPGTIVLGSPGTLPRGCFHAVINCSPIGMAGGPDPRGSPLPDEVKLDDTMTVMDTVYAPRRTPLIAEAQARGARTVTGLDMFLRQAALQFEQWTGRPAPPDAFATPSSTP